MVLWLRYRVKRESEWQRVWKNSERRRVSTEFKKKKKNEREFWEKKGFRGNFEWQRVWGHSERRRVREFWDKKGEQEILKEEWEEILRDYRSEGIMSEGRCEGILSEGGGDGILRMECLKNIYIYISQSFHVFVDWHWYSFLFTFASSTTLNTFIHVLW